MKKQYSSLLAVMAFLLSTSAHSINVPQEDQNPLQNGQQPAHGAVGMLAPGLAERVEGLRQALHAHGHNGNNLAAQLGVQLAPGAPLVEQAEALNQALQPLVPQHNLLDQLFQQ